MAFHDTSARSIPQRIDIRKGPEDKGKERKNGHDFCSGHQKFYPGSLSNALTFKMDPGVASLSLSGL